MATPPFSVPTETVPAWMRYEEDVVEPMIVVEGRKGYRLGLSARVI